jgi:hypothetical protein
MAFKPPFVVRRSGDGGDLKSVNAATAIILKQEKPYSLLAKIRKSTLNTLPIDLGVPSGKTRRVLVAFSQHRCVRRR